MGSPEFEAMVRPARLYPELWRLLVGILVIMFCYLGGLALMLVGVFAAIGPLEYFGWIQGLATPDRPAQTLALLGTFAGLLVGVFLAALVHFRGPGTLFGPRDETLRGFLVTLLVTAPLYGLLIGAGAWIEPPVPNLPWETWLRLLPAALVLLLVQISAEELIFRGYLQQQLAARFAARWVWMGIPSVIFGLLHWNPEAGASAWLIVATTFVFGLVLADLTARTGSLGAALGLHFVNNVAGLLVISISGTITGLALWVTPFGLEEGARLIPSLGFNIVFILVVWRVLVRVLDR